MIQTEGKLIKTDVGEELSLNVDLAKMSVLVSFVVLFGGSFSYFPTGVCCQHHQGHRTALPRPLKSHLVPCDVRVRQMLYALLASSFPD